VNRMLNDDTGLTVRIRLESPRFRFEIGFSCHSGLWSSQPVADGRCGPQQAVTISPREPRARWFGGAASSEHESWLADQGLAELESRRCPTGRAWEQVRLRVRRCCREALTAGGTGRG
jgi:hypothetical protein